MAAILIFFIFLIFVLKASIKDVFRIDIPLPFSDAVSGGWRQADAHVLSLYDTTLCNIDRKFADELSKEEFHSVYRFKKPVIVKFRNGAKDWTDVEKWTVKSLKKEYGMASVLSGNSVGIVRNGGSGYVRSSFTEYIDRLMGSSDEIGDPFYVFDRHFYNKSRLPSTLKLPHYFEVKNDLDDSIFFLGSSGSGVSFHKHADAWNGVVFGRKRWFLYPQHSTPPGGVYPGFTQREWYEKIYHHLTDDSKPMECIQEPGEIMYLPEGIYHGTINLGDTVAVGIQKKEAETDVEKLFYTEKTLNREIASASSFRKGKLKQKQLQTMVDAVFLIPDNSEVHMKLGEIYKSMDNFEMAERHLNKAIELDEYFVIAFLNLAGLKTRMGQAKEAERIYRKTLDMNPNLWDIYAQFGDFLLQQNRPKEAAEMYREGTEIEPDMLQFWYQLKRAQLAAGDLDGARVTQREIDSFS